MIESAAENQKKKTMKTSKEKIIWTWKMTDASKMPIGNKKIWQDNNWSLGEYNINRTVRADCVLGISLIEEWRCI